MKKSFILHNDSLDILDEISIEQAGKLFLAIRNFNIGKEQELDNETKLLFLHFKNQFVRDNEKYKNKSEINAINGSKGGKRKVANATKRKRTLKDVAILADNDNDSDNDSVIDKKKSEFKNSLTPFLEIYGRDMLNDFFAYWTEPNKSKTKLKWELNDTWDVSRRLKTWAKNDLKFEKPKPTPTILQGII